MTSSATAEWETPTDLFHQLHSEFNFRIDCAATPGNNKLDAFYSLDPSGLGDGLKSSWNFHGRAAWCNPPYGRAIAKWMQKGWEESQTGCAVVMLVPARVGTKWWKKWVTQKAKEVRFIEGGVKFTNDQGVCESAPFDSAIVIYRPQLGSYKWWSVVP